MDGADMKKSHLPVVGIGASAGGLEALEKFFRSMPATSGMAFVVIQHLDPDHDGVMAELLQRVTPMKVLQAENVQKIRPDHVYVIPPNKSLMISDEGLKLADPSQPRGLRLPIDIFFRSLANSSFDKVAGIILSGMGSDGSLGLKAIKEKNGLVLVQDPEDAKFDGMPHSAIQSVNPDIVASADELPLKLIDLLKIPVRKKEPVPGNKSDLDKIIFLLWEKTAHDFSLYKKTTLYRRIERRQEVHKIEKIKDYVHFLAGNPAEIEILFRELLIGVTNFFRDPEVWTRLREDTLPRLIEMSPDDTVLRAWVTGCSTGEEAYSLAISFKESLQVAKKLRNISLQIFATDIDHDAIEKARRGVFSPNIEMDLSSELLRRYFVPEGDGFRVNSTLREMIVFAEQNVIRDPPFTKLDILTCRNLLIYMEPELQKKIVGLFFYALKPEGILVLGTSESLGAHRELFEELDAKLKIFSRSTGQGNNMTIDAPSTYYRHETKDTEKKMTAPKTTLSLESVTDKFVLQNYAPATVLVNEKGDIIYFTGHTGKYLEPVAGKTNWNIISMAHEGLRYELPRAFRQALKSDDPVIIRNVRIGTKNSAQHVDVIIENIKEKGPLNGLIIVAFNDVPAPPVQDKSRKITTGKSDENKDDIVQELKKAYEDLQSTREEMQTSQEELKSTNEELQSTNEELQSTNEELTTSKEEMQSLNEELQTVNSELQSKINDLLLSNNDMKNLLNSTEIATLFLDRELNIRRFTDPVYKIFNIRSADIGRPYTDIVNTLNYPGMKEDARKVLSSLIPIVTEARTNSDLWYSVRIMPYRTNDDRIDGLVITFTDITLAKRLEFQLKEVNTQASKQINSSVNEEDGV